MNQRGDKINPVSEQGYEIRVLIEFSSPGPGCGALNIIEFDRLMKRAPTLAAAAATAAFNRRELQNAVYLLLLLLRTLTHECSTALPPKLREKLNLSKLFPP